MRPHQPCAELALNPRSGLMLPTTLGSWLKLVGIVGGTSQTIRKIVPRGSFETLNPKVLHVRSQCHFSTSCFRIALVVAISRESLDCLLVFFWLLRV